MKYLRQDMANRQVDFDIFFIENDIMFCTFYHFIFHIYRNPYKIKTLESSKKFFDQLMVELSYKVSKIFGL